VDPHFNHLVRNFISVAPIVSGQSKESNQLVAIPSSIGFSFLVVIRQSKIVHVGPATGFPPSTMHVTRCLALRIG
jgi:hypothetical protein